MNYIAKAYGNIDVKEIERKVAACSGFVKMMTGVANNCAYVIMMDCLDQIRKHPKYTKPIRRQFEGKNNSVLAFFRQYRNRLRWPMGNDVAFFHINDMPPEARKKYGVITDSQYFEFWESTGTHAYMESRPWVTSLWNKFRLSLIHHNVPCPEIAAWGLVGSSALELAVETWERSMRSVKDAIPELSETVLKDIYGAFNMQKVATQWHKAMAYLAPEMDSCRLDELEEKNIAIGLNQLRELWVSPDLPFDATIKAVEDYSDEIFRTKGEVKKALRELSEMRNSAIEDIEEQKNFLSQDG